MSGLPTTVPSWGSDTFAVDLSFRLSTLKWSELTAEAADSKAKNPQSRTPNATAWTMAWSETPDLFDSRYTLVLSSKSASQLLCLCRKLFALYHSACWSICLCVSLISACPFFLYKLVFTDLEDRCQKQRRPRYGKRILRDAERYWMTLMIIDLCPWPTELSLKHLVNRLPHRHPSGNKLYKNCLQKNDGEQVSAKVSHGTFRIWNNAMQCSASQAASMHSTAAWHNSDDGVWSQRTSCKQGH